MRKLIVKDDTKHTCNLCDNTSDILYKLVDGVRVKKTYLCDNCFKKIVKEALEEE